MRKTLIFLMAMSLGSAAAAEDANERGLIERGAEMLLEGLLQEMEPAIDEMQALGERLTPAFRDFVKEMGPSLTQLFEKVEDWSRYDPPEILENGDIIIRRRVEEPAPEDEIEI